MSPRSRNYYKQHQEESLRTQTVPPGAHFTPEEDEVVRDTSLTLLEIAKRLGRAYSCVINRRQKLYRRAREQQAI